MRRTAAVAYRHAPVTAPAYNCLLAVVYKRSRLLRSLISYSSFIITTSFITSLISSINLASFTPVNNTVFTINTVEISSSPTSPPASTNPRRTLDALGTPKSPTYKPLV